MAETGTPARCIDTCPLVMQATLEEYQIILSRNCRGPRISFDDIDSRIEIRRDGTATDVGKRVLVIKNTDGTEGMVEFVDSTSGELVCTNAGANISIDNALKKGNEA